jgi:phosphatidylglycerol---prolipoprotein diacylglyceryl transferase
LAGFHGYIDKTYIFAQNESSMALLHYIIWNTDPAIVTLFGREIRWYGLLFGLGFLISQQILFYIHRKEGKPEKDVETLTIYMIIATIIGARLGHVLFYEPEKYWPNVWDVFKVWEGGLASHGAAAGILFALWVYAKYDITFKKTVNGQKKSGFFATKISRPGQNYLQVVDRIVIMVALTGCLIRFGNFMNSEIVGKPTLSENGVVFGRLFTQTMDEENSPVGKITYAKPESPETNEAGHQRLIAQFHFNNRSFDEGNIDAYLKSSVAYVLTNQRFNYLREHVYLQPGEEIQYTLSQENGYYVAHLNIWGIPRHPAQLYESLSSLLLSVVLFFIWMRHKQRTPPGRLLGIFLIVLFGLRFLYEFMKENQVAFENELPLNMGQWLSIPLVLAGVFILIRSFKLSREKYG